MHRAPLPAAVVASSHLHRCFCGAAPHGGSQPSTPASNCGLIVTRQRCRQLAAVEPAGFAEAHGGRRGCTYPSGPCMQPWGVDGWRFSMRCVSLVSFTVAIGIAWLAVDPRGQPAAPGRAGASPSSHPPATDEEPLPQSSVSAASLHSGRSRHVAEAVGRGGRPPLVPNGVLPTAVASAAASGTVPGAGLTRGSRKSFMRSLRAAVDSVVEISSLRTFQIIVAQVSPRPLHHTRRPCPLAIFLVARARGNHISSSAPSRSTFRLLSRSTPESPGAQPLPLVELRLCIPVPCAAPCMQGIVGTMPWNATAFLTLWLQLLGFSDWHASVLSAAFYGACSAGAFLGGFVGDRAARCAPNSGRITTAQVSVRPSAALRRPPCSRPPACNAQSFRSAHLRRDGAGHSCCSRILEGCCTALRWRPSALQPSGTHPSA